MYTRVNGKLGYVMRTRPVISPWWHTAHTSRPPKIALKPKHIKIAHVKKNKNHLRYDTKWHEMTRFRWKWHATPYCLRGVTTTSLTLRGATTAPSTRHPRHAMTRNDTRQKRKKHRTTATKLFVRISTLEALEYRNHRYGVPNAVVMVCSGNLVGVTNKQNQITSCLIFLQHVN